ncbi:DUF5676 family membrane protein [Robiginitalea biformata]|uniref:Uncharacterized protein n=1 Tax=Robiginitalea biformata (strain ATCC BAA-864 / DSM 15991 / KCTC 12146 / HTCC2501) TaxID=313596 RepID=A4CGX8_ROBBH|nr:DUF5676 family membrane protein [Robiginitalea biformata]EAR16186.1 hypothetical protein RB2501_04790 [Robiginitalea biformata HTCC2501]
MNRINIKKLGFAMGLTGALVYLGCIVVMLTAGREGTIDFFNSLLHGLDTTSIIRMDVPLWEAAIGIVQTFIIGWLIGALIAAFYNVQLKNRRV